jgi:hypothetical protein
MPEIVAVLPPISASWPAKQQLAAIKAQAMLNPFQHFRRRSIPRCLELRRRMNVMNEYSWLIPILTSDRLYNEPHTLSTSCTIVGDHSLLERRCHRPQQVCSIFQVMPVVLPADVEQVAAVVGARGALTFQRSIAACGTAGGAVPAEGGIVLFVICLIAS